MTNAQYTHIKTVVDRSGSMRGLKNDMIGGMNEFFKSQNELPGKCLVDYSQFDNIYELVFEDVDVADAKAVLEPRGGTALLDAIGYATVELGEKLDKLDEDEKPGKVIVVVVTDGFENSSKEWSPEKVKELIQTQENDFSWEFVFLGANMDAEAIGTSYGFNPDRALTYNTSNIGATSASLSGYATATRSGLSSGFTQADRDANA